MMEEHTPQITGQSLIEKIAYVVLGIVAFLIPFFFIPNNLFQPNVAKVLLFSLGTVATFVVFIIALIRNGRIAIPKNLFFLSIALLPLVFIVSAIANGGNATQYIGNNFDTGSAGIILLLAVMTYLVSELYQKKERTLYAYVAFFVSFAVVSVYELIRLFMAPGTLSFGGLFPTQVANMIGNWNDLGVFFGASTVLSLITLEMLALKRIFKVVMYIVFALSILLLAVVNFASVWVVLAIFSLVVFVYVVSFDKFSASAEFAEGNQISESSSRKRKISYTAIVLFVVSLVFVIWGTTLNNKISGALNISNVEVRPSLSSTYVVIQGILQSKPLLGSGPNTFITDWYLFRPREVNSTIFWGTDFPYGFGLIPTFFVMTGVLGILSWLFFFGLLVWKGLRAIFQSVSDLSSRYLITSSFMLSLFFWIMAVIYVPSIANIFLAFFFTGLFSASLYRENMLSRREVSLVNYPKLSFVSVLVLIVLMIGSITLGYVFVQRTASFVYFQKSVLGFQKDNNVENARAYMNRAAAAGGYDIYYRGLSELSLVQLDAILARPGATADSIRGEFQQVLADSIENAKKATQVNPSNYQNWVGLARVYAALVPAPFSVPGAYENAKQAYEEALKTNPHSPILPLLLARLEVSHNDLKAARVYVNTAIAEKPNYAEAHLLLSQIEVTEGNLTRAIPSLETALLLSPNNPGLYFQLGLLKYNERDFNGAGVAFENAVKIVPDYANAKYFLGITASKVGNTAYAIQQFEDLAKSNPNNPEVTNVLANLKAGKDPFAGAKPPVNQPEKRKTLPLEQTN